MKEKCVLKEREIQNTQWQSRSVRLRVIHRWGPQVSAAAGSARSEWAELLSNLLLSGLDYFSKPQESGLKYFLTFYCQGWMWQLKWIQASILTNPCKELEKSMYQSVYQSMLEKYWYQFWQIHLTTWEKSNNLSKFQQEEWQSDWGAKKAMIWLGSDRNEA